MKSMNCSQYHKKEDVIRVTNQGVHNLVLEQMA